MAGGKGQVFNLIAVHLFSVTNLPVIRSENQKKCERRYQSLHGIRMNEQVLQVIFVERKHHDKINNGRNDSGQYAFVQGTSIDPCQDAYSEGAVDVCDHRYSFLSN